MKLISFLAVALKEGKFSKFLRLQPVVTWMADGMSYSYFNISTSTYTYTLIYIHSITLTFYLLIIRVFTYFDHKFIFCAHSYCPFTFPSPSLPINLYYTYMHVCMEIYSGSVTVIWRRFFLEENQSRYSHSQIIYFTVIIING